MSETKTFHLNDILSITTGVLSPNGMEGVYSILNYMTGDDLYTVALPRAADECKPYLLIETPWLAEINATEVNRHTAAGWFAEQAAHYGKWHEVRPIHFEDHMRIDPSEELRQMDVDGTIIEVNLDDE